MQAIALLVALLSPAVASAGAGAIYPPDPRFIPGTYLPYQTFLGGLGVSSSLAEPSFQAINTGTGNAMESYVQTPGTGLILSYRGSTNSSGNQLGGDPARPYLAVRHEAGFAELFGNDAEGAGTDFVGGGLVLGGDRGGRGLYADRGYGRVRWLDAFGGMLEFRTLRQGQLFGFGSGASGSNESFFTIADGLAVWNFRARSSNVPAVISYLWGCSANDRPTHTLWSDASGNTIGELLDTGTSGHLRLPGAGGTVSVGGAVLPTADNTATVGNGSFRFASVRAVTVTTGDLGFEDECCPVCGREFAVDDDVVWRVRRKDGKVSFAVPVHVECRGPKGGRPAPRGPITNTANTGGRVR